MFIRQWLYGHTARGTADVVRGDSRPDRIRWVVAEEQPEIEYALSDDYALTLTFEDPDATLTTESLRGLFMPGPDPRRMVIEVANGTRSPRGIWSQDLNLNEIRSLAMLLLTAKDLSGPIEQHAKRHRWKPFTAMQCGVMLHNAGDIRGALRYYRKAARDGNLASRLILADIPFTLAPIPLPACEALVAVGALALQSGESDLAAREFTRVAKSGDSLGYPLGHWGLAVAALRRGDNVTAEYHSRAAAVSGLPEAMCLFGQQLAARSDLEQAEHWFRSAYEKGCSDAVVGLAQLLWRDNPDEAFRILDTGAQNANADAMLCLGDALSASGEPQRGRWWRRQGELLQQVRPVEQPRRTLQLCAEAAPPDRPRAG
ncbi:hypothetical protein [Nocardia wallacei]|uniref:hypothetical protein n=1 Tax=Nocardia wallacei TaxID=480035 RepID=UPI002454FEB9|nr:hypothetical protein [Nocardia wallacei]